MVLSLSWLREFVNPRLKPEALAEALTRSGTEVTGIRRLDADVSKVIVGQVKTLIQHPHADRLKIAKVDVGRSELWEIVCGAPNVAPGQKVAVAPIGVRLPNGLTIEERRIRGVASRGMLCADDELGFGGDHTGILVLDDETPVGEKLTTALGLPDVLFDIDLTPNRGDCYSVLGLAREVAALTSQRLKRPPNSAIAPTDKAQVTARVAEPTLAPLYCIREVHGVSVGASPASIRNSLRAAGLRPVNVVVDITNYVLLELGQPLHAFDTRTLSGRRVVVRRARAKERLVTLDGEARILGREHLVIADAKRPVALAGVMGGLETGVSPKTKSVVLEAAIFHPRVPRASRRTFNLTSEAAMRFERGVDPAQVEQALDRVCQLLRQHAGARRFGPTVRVGSPPRPPKAVVVDPVHVTNLLGVAVTPKRMTDLLTRLGFRVAPRGEVLSVTPPSWRHDVHLEADLAEEVGRLMDYNTFRPTLPAMPTSLPVPDPARAVRKEICRLLLAAGYSEVVLRSFIDATTIATFGLTTREHVPVANPLSEDQRFLRRSLVPALVTAAARNAVSRERVDLFELGHVFAPKAKGQGIDEQEKLAWVSVGRDAVAQARGAIDLVVERLHVPQLRVQQHSREAFFASGGTVFARLELLAPALRLTLKLKQPVAVVVLDPATLAKLSPARTSFDPLPTFPAVSRDLSFWCAREAMFAAFVAVTSGTSSLIERVECRDVFEQGGRRSYTLRYTFRAPDRSLEGGEVDKLVERLKRLLTERFQAEFR